MAAIPPVCDFNQDARAFKLKGVDGKMYQFDDIKGSKGTLIMFICNHCPYVIAVLDRIVRDANELSELGVGVVAICSNDSKTHPDDSYENMKIFSKKNIFSFPYLHDEDQSVAEAYEAVCTPDFFGYNKNLELQYRGRLRELKNLIPVRDGESDLLKAMKQITETGKGPENQTPSAGCGIKWKQ